MTREASQRIIRTTAIVIALCFAIWLSAHTTQAIGVTAGAATVGVLEILTSAVLRRR